MRNTKFIKLVSTDVAFRQFPCHRAIHAPRCQLCMYSGIQPDVQNTNFTKSRISKNWIHTFSWNGHCFWHRVQCAHSLKQFKINMTILVWSDQRELQDAEKDCERKAVGTFPSHSAVNHRPWTKWPPFCQMTFSDAFSWMKRIQFRFKFHWNMF